MQDAEAPKPGLILGGRYQLTDEIGRGGFGMVYRAHQLNMEREVAVKILPPRFLAIPDVVERFKREAQLASRLRHPNTITVHDYGQQDNYLYIVMELLRGEDLADVLKRERKLDPARAVHVAKQVLRSLAEAHEQGIVHRDLKPENIFLTKLSGENDFVKVLDFGIAKVAQPGGSRDPNMRQLTVTGSTVGTPVYMSPEQAAGEDVDQLTDLYALGVIIYEMVAGVPPFHDENPVKVMRSHLFEQVPPLKSPSLQGTPLEAVIMRVLEKDRHARFANAQAFLDALDNKRPAVVGLPPSLMHPPSPAKRGTLPMHGSDLSAAVAASSKPADEDEPPTLELDREALASTSSETSTNETSAFGAQRREAPHTDTPPSSPRLRPPPGFTAASSTPADAISFNAGAPSAPPAGFNASRSTTTSSIMTIIDSPPEAAAEEVFLLTRPKTAQLEVPSQERGSGEFISELSGLRPLPQEEEVGLAPLSSMNTPALPAKSPAVSPSRTPGRTPKMSEWSWDPSAQAELEAAQRGAITRTPEQPTPAVVRDPRYRVVAAVAVVIVLVALIAAFAATR
jgi:serine/threonine protein kinase